MAWKGFLTESKLYMNHPDHWKEWNHHTVLEGGWTAEGKRIARLEFWKAFPKAWVKFHWHIIRDWIRAI